MSVILNALKTQAEENKPNDQKKPLEQGLFLTDTPAHLERNYLPRSILYPLLSVFLILVGGSVYYYFYYSPAKPKVQIAQSLPAVRLAPSVGELSKTAKSFVESDQISEALGAYEKALNLEPENPLIYNDLAYLFITQKEYNLAQTNLDLALKIDKNCIECLNNLGFMRTLQNKPEEAEQSLRKAIILAPENPAPYFNLGVLYEKNGNFEAAKGAFEAFVDYANPKSSGEIIAKVKLRIKDLERL